MDLSGQAGFQVNLTTNGTLLRQKLPQLLDRPALRQVNLSLHSFEGDQPQRLQEYLDSVLEGVNALRQETGAYLVLRLWNLLAGDAMPKNNRVILERLSREFAIDLFEEIAHREKVRSITLAPPGLFEPGGGIRLAQPAKSLCQRNRFLLWPRHYGRRLGGWHRRALLSGRGWGNRPGELVPTALWGNPRGTPGPGHPSGLYQAKSCGGALPPLHLPHPL